MGSFLRTLLIGIGIGLLIAPKRGEETRQLLMARLQQLGNSAQNVGSQFSSQTSTGSVSDAERQLKSFAGSSEQNSKMYIPSTGTTYESAYPDYVNPEQ